MSPSEHATKRFAWSSQAQARLVRLVRAGVLGSVVTLALAMAAIASYDVVVTASAVGLVLLLVSTAATYTAAFTRAETWVMLAVPLLDLSAIASLHLVPGDESVALLLIIPAIWLGGVAGVYGAFVTVAATFLLFVVPGSEAGAPHGGWAELAVIVAFAGIVSGATVMLSALWEDRLAQLAAALTVVEQHQSHIQAIFEAVPVGVVELGLDGSYLSMNDRHREFVAALGYSGDHVGQKDTPGHLYAADNRRLLEHDELPSVRAAAGESFDEYVVWVGPDADQRRATSVSARQVPGSDGGPGGSVLAYHDITDLMRALSVKDDFVASVSHELRTPLTSIIGYLDLAQDSGDDLPADIAHFLTVASRNADRLLVLVSDLLTAASAERVAMELQRTGTDLSALVLLSVDDAKEAARNGGVRLDQQVESIPTAMLDTGRIQQVVEHLLSNAVKYTKPGGSVTTSLALVDSEIVLEVADTGTGISASDQQHLFDKFFRAADVASSTIPGIGLGLPLCQQVVLAHEGRIEVTSVVGAGTTVKVFLPFVAASPQRAAVRRAASPA